MRRPKRTEFKDQDTFHALYRSHGNENAVTVHVTEIESGPEAGKLIVEVISGKGNVELRFAPTSAFKTEAVREDAEGRPRTVVTGELVGHVVFCKLREETC